MYRSPLKPVLLGLLLGVALIAIPFFLLKAALSFLLLGALFRFVGRRVLRGRRARFGAHPYAYGMAWHPAFADTIRRMSEEDYSNRSGGGTAFERRAPFIDAEFWEGMRGGFLRRPKYNVPLNIAETDTTYEVHVYAVGFDKENITITVEDDVLWIRGKRAINQDNPPKFRRQEFPVKHFERVVSLHGQVDTAQIQAKQEGAVLMITLPKVAEAQSSAQKVSID